MKIGIVPIKICWGKNEGYGIYILGFDITAHQRLLGFVIRKEKEVDRSVWKLYLSAWYFYKHINLKTILDDYYVRCEQCGNLIWKHNGYCSYCNECPNFNEQTFVYRKTKGYEDIIEDLKGNKYKIEYENK